MYHVFIASLKFIQYITIEISRRLARMVSMPSVRRKLSNNLQQHFKKTNGSNLFITVHIFVLVKYSGH